MHGNLGVDGGPCNRTALVPRKELRKGCGLEGANQRQEATVPGEGRGGLQHLPHSLHDGGCERVLFGMPQLVGASDFIRTHHILL